MTSFHRATRLAVALTAATAFLVGLQPASAGLSWAPASTALIHPGVQLYTNGAQCTANFIFQDSAGAVYIGQAAHCSSTGGSTSTNGCSTGTLPVGTSVQVRGSNNLATMVYNSWATMQGKTPPETDAATCAYNDFALIKLATADWPQVNPSVPFWGGPSGLRTSPPLMTTGSAVYSYGNSSLRFGLTQLSPKRGVSFGDSGWSHAMYTVTPGIPGDSGSGFMDGAGKAFGVLSTIAIAPYAASNNAGDLSRELDYMHAHSAYTSVNLVAGTTAFAPIV